MSLQVTLWWEQHAQQAPSRPSQHTHRQSINYQALRLRHFVKERFYLPSGTLALSALQLRGQVDGEGALGVRGMLKMAIT